LAFVPTVAKVGVVARSSFVALLTVFSDFLGIVVFHRRKVDRLEAKQKAK